jgi:hypothetical protein
LEEKSYRPEEKIDPGEKEGEEQRQKGRNENEPGARTNVGLETARPNQEENSQTD